MRPSENQPRDSGPLRKAVRIPIDCQKVVRKLSDLLASEAFSGVF
ncbi:hypothetical protein LCGC14_1541050 [marine sediment metagenome]|uniref:Uncharacterized protein n=1 Tax=marine sediment metagenome TaxID=412755 RepID=A0A0F9L930_9ZZZZ